jgi:(4S)-4-hydroxy-5-phosphonooxypentane-2,3-dione isomerase
MHVTLVHVRVIPGRLDEFLAASRENYDGSVREPGNVRFDILRDPNDAARFLIYEVFADAEAAAAHKRTPHYLAWRDRVAAMMAEPRRGEPWDAVLVDAAPARG